jgi:putative tRNA adenosine deaminase-associated protein
VLTVAYFAALLARSADRWQARDADLDEIEDLAGLTELMREVSDDDDEEPDTAVLLLEQEDVWFAVVRVDADDEPRVFVSDAAAISRSAYAELLLAAGLPAIGVTDRVADGGDDREEPVALDVDGDDPVGVPEVGEPDPEAEAVELVSLAPYASAEAAVPLPRSGPAGDIDLLVDLGVPAKALTSLCTSRRPTAEALADLAEALGAAEELESVR